MLKSSGLATAFKSQYTWAINMQTKRIKKSIVSLFICHILLYKNVSRLVRRNVDCILGSDEISREGLLEALTEIDTNEGAGPDGIPPLFL